MDLLDIIKDRRSVRDFTDQQIPGDAVNVFIEALRWAPSAGNLQSRKFYFILNKEIRNKLAQAGLRPGFVSFIANAPLVIAACVDYERASHYKERGKNLYCIQDCAASIQNLLLAAHALGLGACWIGAFNEEKVSEILALPDNLRPVAVVPVGYPARTPKAPDRVPAADAVEIMP